jgi:hypothetical protein
MKAQDRKFSFTEVAVKLDRTRPIASVVALDGNIWAVSVCRGRATLSDPYKVMTSREMAQEDLYEMIDLRIYDILFYKDEIPKGGF